MSIFDLHCQVSSFSIFLINKIDKFIYYYFIVINGNCFAAPIRPACLLKMEVIKYLKT